MGGGNSSASQYVVGLLFSMVWCKYNSMVWYVIVMLLVRVVSIIDRMISTGHFMYVSSPSARRVGTTAAQPARTEVTQRIMNKTMTMKTTVVQDSRRDHCRVHFRLQPIRSIISVLVFLAVVVGAGNGGGRRVGRLSVPVETSNKLPSLPPPNTKAKLDENENQNVKENSRELFEMYFRIFLLRFSFQYSFRLSCYAKQLSNSIGGKKWVTNWRLLFQIRVGKRFLIQRLRDGPKGKG